MDQDQFQEFLQTITTAFQGMLQQPRNNIVLVSNFESFESSKESFHQYKERFENYLKLKNVFDDKKICTQIFLNSIGPSTYDLLSTLSSPRIISEMTYDEVTQLLENYYPKQNDIIEQHKLLSRVQKPDESISEYVTALKRQVSSCKLTCSACEAPVSDLFLRAQFIRGIHDSTIRENLLQQKDLTFDLAVEKSLAIEASKLDNNAIKELSRSQYSSDIDINKLGTKSHYNQLITNRNKHYTTSRQNWTPQNEQRVNFQRQRQNQLMALGLNNVCLRCGKHNHKSSDCKLPRSRVHCKECGKDGHIDKVCITTLLSNQKYSASVKNLNDDNQSEQSDDFDLHGVGDIFNVYDTYLSDTDKFITTVLINGKPQKFEVDSGSAHTLIPKADFQQLHIPLSCLEPTNIKFRSYTKEVFSPLGVASVRVDFNGVSSNEQLFVVPDGYNALLGRTWIRRLNISLNSIDNSSQNENNINTLANTVDELIHKIETTYSDILTPTIGCIPNLSTNLQLRPQTKPVFIKPRPLPFALRDQVGEELDRLEKDNIITKIDLSDWGSPLVVVPKPDGSLRLCADYKTTVNPQLYDAHYPIPRIDENIHKLRNANYFCTLDLYKAYLHVAVDDESAHIQAISTHKGTYKVNRLSFGIKTAPSIFNQVIEQILGDLPGVSTYFDDIIVFGSTLDECYKNLCSCLERLKKNDLHLNHKKCLFFRKSITYLGFVIEHNKISKSPTKVASILNAEPPKSVDDVRKFLGLVTYYSKFIPSAATLTYPLRQLLTKNKNFQWNKECEDAFNRIKCEIASDRVLVPYDPNLPLSLACDASPYGIAGVLSHTINGIERPIAFASRSLTKAESQYSQLDREALAIVFSVNRFFQYLFGRKFDLITDNQPLTRIFHPNNVPPMSAGRLLRYAVFLRGFEYNIRHRKASEHSNVDYLSRSTVLENFKGIDSAINKEVEEIEQMSILQLTSIEISSNSIAQETAKDVTMKAILNQLKNGTNDPMFSLNQGVVFRGERVYIPVSLRSQVLQELHSTHVGIVRMKRLARRYCYWPGIDKDIEHNVRSCVPCSINQKQPNKITHSWDTPDTNFERVHMDYAGPFHGHHFLVVVDAKSKWPEVRITRSAPTTEITIDLLHDIFSQHGYPVVLVSDNASIFTSSKFQQFCKQSGIIQKFSAPGHPATNGLAERYVQTIKSALKRNMDDQSSTSLKEGVRNILFRYRATPLQCGKSPAELYLNRKIRTKLDVLRPQMIVRVYKDYSQVPRSFSRGERVLVRMGEQWKFGKIISRLGSLHYEVQLDSGYVLKKHINQLKRTEVSEPSDKPNRNAHSKNLDVVKQDLKLKKVSFDDGIENSDLVVIPHHETPNHQPITHTSNHQPITHTSNHQPNTHTPNDQLNSHIPNRQNDSDTHNQQPRKSSRHRRPPQRFSP